MSQHFVKKNTKAHAQHEFLSTRLSFRIFICWNGPNLKFVRVGLSKKKARFVTTKEFSSLFALGGARAPRSMRRGAACRVRACVWGRGDDDHHRHHHHRLSSPHSHRRSRHHHHHHHRHSRRRRSRIRRHLGSSHFGSSHFGLKICLAHSDLDLNV